MGGKSTQGGLEVGLASMAGGGRVDSLFEGPLIQRYFFSYRLRIQI